MVRSNPHVTVLVAEHILSLAHALKIVKGLNKKVHKKVFDFHYELKELGMAIGDHRVDKSFPHLRVGPASYIHNFPRLDPEGTVDLFSDYNPRVEAWHLKVFRTPVIHK